FFKYLPGTEAGIDVHLSQTTQRVPLNGQIKVGLFGGASLLVEMNRLGVGNLDRVAGQPIAAKVDPAAATTIAPPLSQVFVVSGLALGEMNLRVANSADFVTWDSVRIKVVDAPKTVPLTDDLKAEYRLLFSACRVRSSKQSAVDDMAKKITTNKARYAAVGDALNKVPWWVIGIIHAMESGLKF